MNEPFLEGLAMLSKKEKRRLVSLPHCPICKFLIPHLELQKQSQPVPSTVYSFSSKVISYGDHVFFLALKVISVNC